MASWDLALDQGFRMAPVAAAWDGGAEAATWEGGAGHGSLGWRRWPRQLLGMEGATEEADGGGGGGLRWSGGGLGWSGRGLWRGLSAVGAWEGGCGGGGLGWMWRLRRRMEGTAAVPSDGWRLLRRWMEGAAAEDGD